MKLLLQLLKRLLNQKNQNKRLATDLLTHICTDYRFVTEKDLTFVKSFFYFAKI